MRSRQGNCPTKARGFHECRVRTGFARPLRWAAVTYLATQAYFAVLRCAANPADVRGEALGLFRLQHSSGGVHQPVDVGAQVSPIRPRIFVGAARQEVVVAEVALVVVHKTDSAPVAGKELETAAQRATVACAGIRRSRCG